MRLSRAKIALAIGVLLSCLFSSVTFALTDANPKWSVIIYAATDEEELDAHASAILKSYLKSNLPPTVELLIENDNSKTLAKGGATVRYIRTANKTKIEKLPEVDSASESTLKDFLSWAKREAKGEHKLLMMMTHAWGWKGIIQDFTIPFRPDDDTMMPLWLFSNIVQESGLRPEILFLDSCILGNAEAIEELKEISPYLIVSERETPFSGISAKDLFSALENEQSGREVAAVLPELYVKAYSNSGAMSEKEGEYGVVTIAAIDSKNWGLFTDQFKELVYLLRTAGIQKALSDFPSWPEYFSDEDDNVDLVELLSRLPYLVSSEAVRLKTKELLGIIGYPFAAREKSSESWLFKAKHTREIQIRFRLDQFLMAKTNQREKIFEAIKKRWNANNQDLLYQQPQLIFTLDGENFLVSARVGQEDLILRPWLPGVTHIELFTSSEREVWNHKRVFREEDWISTRDFPSQSFLISEAHTQGAPFIHGVGINMEQSMDVSEERAVDPITGLVGRDYYRAAKWNKKTGWADLIFSR